MTVDWPKVVKELDTHIRRGEGHAAKSELRRLVENKVPREFAATFAALAWRAGLPTIGLRVLNPVVRPNRRNPQAASREELAEYAICLTRVGAQEEALGILEGLDIPQALFYRAGTLMALWRYEDARPLLTQYLKKPGLNVYQRLVGKLNLAASLIFLRENRKARDFLRELVYETSMRRLDLLHGNALELSAQNCLLLGANKEADKFLTKAEKFLAGNEALDGFWVKKWRAILEFQQRAGKGTAELRKLLAVRRSAEEQGQWETTRAIDEWIATELKKEPLLWRLYFGTPHAGFRDRLLSDFGETRSRPETYLWSPGGGAKPRMTLDLLTGKVEGGKGELRVGDSLHRLALVLASDFYRPFRVASLYSKLFPGEFYNPLSSPARVYQAVKLFRLWARDHGLPLEIREASGLYRFEATGPFGIRLTLEKQSGDRYLVRLRALIERFSEALFSVEEAARVLELSPRMTLRLLERGMLEGTVERIGKRAYTRYRFARAAQEVA